MVFTMLFPGPAARASSANILPFSRWMRQARSTQSHFASTVRSLAICQRRPWSSFLFFLPLFFLLLSSVFRLLSSSCFSLSLFPFIPFLSLPFFSFFFSMLLYYCPYHLSWSSAGCWLWLLSVCTWDHGDLRAWQHCQNLGQTKMGPDHRPWGRLVLPCRTWEEDRYPQVQSFSGRPAAHLFKVFFPFILFILTEIVCFGSKSTHCFASFALPFTFYDYEFIIVTSPWSCGISGKWQRFRR